MKQMFATVIEDHIGEDQANVSERPWPENESPLGMACSGGIDVSGDVASPCRKSDAKHNLPGRFPGAETYQGSEMALIRAERSKGRHRF